ncbi:SagB family peptide dehydrogenase [Nonomuraea muscovyensis]|uniref:SagB-type dehydrogenase family enzyme n=1 Tax=Nonomuraea muscovyensis TaxID=1124761 RepID=A0A7X0C8M7_9ACTN|nr:SagB family peptide dehydrogenase [Nonomuraea muscovyensis]MBB6350123.1 SagB-type dehydrogenase family enzyme [Nonomuraea muscovyensis]
MNLAQDNRETATARDYVEAVVRRAREPMPPFGFEPDWGDQPYRHKVYTEADHLPLPRDGKPVGPLATGLTPARDAAPEFDLPTLSGMLADSYGLGVRRMGVNGNKDNEGRTWYGAATWARGTASGGGLYPLEIYLVAGRGAPVTPGVYHYYTPRHTLRRLLAGDLTGRVRDALDAAGDSTGASTANCYLLISVKLWKNAFKYNSFSYHAVTMDVGTLLGGWQTWARARGLGLTPRLWYDEEALDRLLGLETAAEGVMAVVPVELRDRPGAPASPPVLRGEPAVARTELERSRTLIRFDQVESVHLAAAAAGAAPPPDAAEAAFAIPAADDVGSIRLPAPASLDMDVRTAVRRRRSSFGRFSARRRLAADKLSALLHHGTEGGRLQTAEVRQGRHGLHRIAVFANHVDGVPSGAYDFTPDGGLHPITGDPLSPFLQQQYFLDNYNLEQAAAVLAVIGRPTAAVEALGARGYRLANADVGALAQAFYTCAAALGVGCGAALGFDNVSLRDRGGLAAGDEWPMLIVMVGHERERSAELDLRMA